MTNKSLKKKILNLYSYNIVILNIVMFSNRLLRNIRWRHRFKSTLIQKKQLSKGLFKLICFKLFILIK